MSYFKVGLIGFLVGYYTVAWLEKRKHIKMINSNDTKIYTNTKFISGILTSCGSLVIHSILLNR